MTNFYKNMATVVFIFFLSLSFVMGEEDGQMVRPPRQEGKPRVYLCTDMEGVAGVIDSKNWCLEDGRNYEEGRRLLMGEINAAVQGFIDAGASEVNVLSGHGYQALIPELLHEDAILQRTCYPGTWPFRADRGYEVIAFVGQHAKAGTPYGHLTHTGSMDVIDLRVNGLSIGEYGRLVLCGKEKGIPTIFASGDEAFCKEAQDLTPGVVTVAVKFGLDPDNGYPRITREQYRLKKVNACHLSPKKARRLIQEKAKEALLKYKKDPNSFQWADHIKAPYKLEMELRPDVENGEPVKVTKEHPSSFIELLKQ